MRIPLKQIADSGAAAGQVPVWNGSAWVPGASVPFGSGLIPLPVNSAGVDVFTATKSVVLRTGSNANPAGAYTGGGTGNKAIVGFNGYDGLPIAALARLEVLWRNVVGPGPGTVLRPYGNFVVDWSPDPLGIRIVVMLDDSLAAAISAAIGTYVGIPGPYPAGPLYDYTWDASFPPAAGGSVLLVAIPGPLGPGGVAPSVSVAGAPFWLTNAFSWSALVAANPAAKLVDVFPADGGMPAGAIIPAANIVSGDSGNVIKSGKLLTSVKINGAPVIGP
jgi:hypothetical protein